MAFILTESTQILCPHGGVVTHTPMRSTNYRINGEFAMLIGDVFIVLWCPHQDGKGPDPCRRVEWSNPSVNLSIRGRRALVHTSRGTCLADSGVVAQPARIISHQTIESEPFLVTIIND